MNTFTFSRRQLSLALGTYVLAACLATRTPSLEAGALADDFTLTSQDDKPVHFAEVNAERWTVVVFYRGFW